MGVRDRGREWGQREGRREGQRGGGEGRRAEGGRGVSDRER